MSKMTMSVDQLSLAMKARRCHMISRQLRSIVAFCFTYSDFRHVYAYEYITCFDSAEGAYVNKSLSTQEMNPFGDIKEDQRFPALTEFNLHSLLGILPTRQEIKAVSALLV